MTTATEPQNVSRETPDEGSTEQQPGTTETAEKTTETKQPAAELTDETDSGDNENSGEQDIGKVRREAAKYRTQLRDTEAELETVRAELFHAKVAATGRLAAPDDMPVNVELLGDDDALTAAIDELLEAKPHLKARTFGGIGMDEKKAGDGVSLASILRRNA